MKLAIFDVDGTLSDSQAHILAAMTEAFGTLGLPLPPRGDVLSIVGLSLPVAMAELAPATDAATQAALVAAYKSSYFTTRAAAPAPLYPGAKECLLHLAGREDLLLAIATGKSRRGVNALIAHHGLEGLFTSAQVADDHPSKPHPAMVLAALRVAGVEAKDAVMIGDTTFDIEMGRAAGVATIGVSWGYHPVSDLEQAGAGRIVESFSELERALQEGFA
ncbi:HAD-IA family hydrolase [Rhodobacter capsulatus]|uniref:HAD-IA family hydrolase n=1 Tax=Rhodobacter capsulatus TaxID=1061 RepID=UPI0006DC6C63|nr:HAD-IA family hydrolase [Rhodobacter capsulatus]KQB13449.1 HAD family hydrolase [Rhodobacter capsulatus]KQB13707.1 HAD family hydrolase [Rhodobacter capsulatus]PZX24453.1 phosphoglycolate phosphatase [Rhodobacter capsulatus]QNR63579.1 HAD-IA family hydrolase [Rhodobacter capsulatus]